MKLRHALLATAVIGTLGLAACKRDAEPAAATPAPAAQPGETADQFVARVNEEVRKLSTELNSAQWLSNTYINGDSELIAAKANERWLAQLNVWIEQSKRYDGQQLKPETARALKLLKLWTAMPAPKDPKKLEELTQLATRMEGMYGAGSYCTGEGAARTCRDIGQLSDVLAKSRDYDAQLDAWQGWHTISVPMRKDYVRFTELVNEGAKEMGFADAGEMWRSGYDMSPAELASESDRLWGQVKPLYEQLHCYARTRLDAQYGKDKGEVAGGLLPAHLMGNLWQQDWSNLWDILQPYKAAGSLDINSALERMAAADLARELAKPAAAGTSAAERSFAAQRAAQLATAKAMTERAQDFYVSLGMPKLPESYWQKSQFIKPMDRDVVCHASAWDMNMAGDVRTKMCIVPSEEELTTIYHELGHIYYDLAYNKQPPIFQNGAHDGFHEAIGDTIVLAMTPQYLASVGLVDAPKQSQEALINAQMRMALAKVAFLPFGLMIDRWRWGVFDGSIKPDGYNKAWWELKAKYQGVAPATARGEDFFDPGAKYHVPGNTPYTRYFLSHILQFQFYKALCDASGHKGPLYECSFYGNKEAGQRYWAMLSKGNSQPWQQTMKELTGGEKMDASAVLEYFAPLQTWLKEQNAGSTCGWNAAGTVAAPATPAKAG
ncbi:M2 family metallopeptidase [Thermomonas sp. XSG]|uniref:M2 family metallopeptidase n=1 Tax=Thermomonas sp. XSG TaxID=2771436 RepID=UPI001681B8F6|nr:M2 family metallopeptidase [Thermomonas sp. XSG]QNU15797.1 M2 family metallopeptidase [Thermomonas sp. XSG]